MKAIKNIISHNINIKDYFSEDNICFIDIETTGLSRTKNMIYLIGILYFDETLRMWILEQFFADTKDDEKSILEAFLNRFENFNKLITFNGNSFDIPFIEERLKFYNIDYKFNMDNSVDLYRIVKSNSQFLKLPNLKLKTIEMSLGYIREDIYTGFDCIIFYEDYIKYKDLSLKHNILKHNYDDLVHMLDVMKILDVLREAKSFHIGAVDTNLIGTIDSISKKKDLIVINGAFNVILNQPLNYYGDGFTVLCNDAKNFSITLETTEGYLSEDLICNYIDSNNMKILSNLYDSSNYPVASNIILVSVDKKYEIDNIKEICRCVLSAI